MKIKLISSLLILVAVAVAVFANRTSVPEIELQTCGGAYVLASYNQPYPIPFGQLDVADATAIWTAEGCTDIAFKPAGDGNFLGYGVRVGFAQ